MSKKKKGRSQRSAFADYSDYYDEENRRSAQSAPRFQSYYEREASARSVDRRKRASHNGSKRSRTSGRSHARRGSSRYRLAHPEKLVFSLIVFLVFILILVLLIRSLFGSDNSDSESGSSVQIVQNVASSGETGTVRPVNTTDLGSVPNQMAAYMAGMVNQNPNNFSKDPTIYKVEEVKEGVDPFEYDYYIAIDAGHGGTDTGYEMDGVQEKEIALAVSQKIVEYINSHAPKYYAFLTRSGDANMGDQQRLNCSIESSANLIISIHCNGSEQELGGTTAAYWTGPDDDAARAAQSQMLAESLMEAAADGFGMWYRETRMEDTPLLRAKVPAVQLELGYVTYYLDNELMSDEELQDAAAAKIGEVLIAYMDEMSPAFVDQRKSDRQESVQQQLNELAGITESSTTGDSSFTEE